MFGKPKGPTLDELIEEHPAHMKAWLNQVKANNPDTRAGRILNELIDEKLGRARR